MVLICINSTVVLSTHLGDLLERLLDPHWRVEVRHEEWHRLLAGRTENGRYDLHCFSFLQPSILSGFRSATVMAALAEQTVALRSRAHAKGEDKSFAEKCPLYAQSTTLLTQEVADHENWGPKEIDDRQRRLSELARLVWPI
jgi:Protein of unknown function (DUF1524)